MKDNLNRLAAFHAMKEEIRGSADYLLVGIDVAKDRHHSFFGTALGKTLRKRFIFDNTRAGIDQLVALANDLQTRHGLTQRVFGLEPTGVYHKPLLEELLRRGETAVLVSNVAVAKNRQLLNGRWDKNDTADSANVADLVAQARCLFADVPEADIRELRHLVDARVRYKKAEHSIRMRIRNHVAAQFFPELDCAYGQGGLDMVVLAVIRNGIDPLEIAKLDFEAFWNKIASPRWSKVQEPRVRAVWENAKVSIGCAMSDAVRWEALRLVEQLDALRKNLRDLELRMRTVAKRMPSYRCVMSIPGIGPMLAAMIIAAIGDPRRFQHPRQLLRLAGLDLCASRSGKSSNLVVPKISKQGKGGLRYSLVQASIIASRTNAVTRTYFSRLLKGREQERGIKLKMHVKMASKLLVVAWTLMKRGETFDPEVFMS